MIDMPDKKRYSAKPATLFYVFEMFDEKGKWVRDVQIMTRSYREAVSKVRREFKQFHNHRVKNSNDPKLLKL